MKLISELTIPQSDYAVYRVQKITESTSDSFIGSSIDTGEGTIYIVDVQYEEKVVVVFARAFNIEGQPIGFGPNGEVEIERFRIVNPPTLIDDPNGDIKQTWFNETKKIEEVRFLREDPKQALINELTSTIKIIGKDGSNIQPGKIGNTTTTIYADTGDGTLRSSNATWSTARNATNGTTQLGTSTSYIASELEAATYNIYTGFWMFNTSSIPSTDTISSATFSVSLNGDNQIGDSQTLAVGQSTQSTWNSLVSGDFDNRGYNTTLGSAGITHPTGTTTGYLDFALNASGIDFIARNGETKPGSASASGKTQLTLIYSSDSSNTTPTARCYAQIRMAEQAGTTNDPKLVIEHTASATTPLCMLMGVGT